MESLMKGLTFLHALSIAILPAAALAQNSTVAVQVSDQINQAAGVNGRLQLPMSTSFQLAPWSYQFFTSAHAFWAVKRSPIFAICPQETSKGRHYPRAFGLKSEEADRQRKKEKARQKAARMMNYGGEKES